MWPFKKKTEIQKAFAKYGNDANKFLGYLAEYFKVITIDLTEDEKKREIQHLIQVIIDNMGVDFLSRFEVFRKENQTNVALLKELTTDERFVEKRNKFQEYIKLRRIKEAEENKLSNLRELCISVCQKLNVSSDVIMKYIDDAIAKTKQSGEDIPESNLRNAYLLVFNSIVLELCENDYRFDGYILNPQGSMYEEKLKEIADCLFNEGYESKDVRDEILRNAFDRIHNANQQKDEVDKLREQGIPTFSFESENEKKYYEMRYGKQAIWEMDPNLDFLYNEALKSLKNKDYSSSIERFNQCLKLNPVSKRSLLGLCECYIACEKDIEAKEILDNLDGLLETNEDIAIYYKLYALYEKMNQRLLTAYACIKYCIRFTKNHELNTEADIISMDILVANGESFSESPTEILKTSNIKIYSYIPFNYDVPKNNDFWDSVKICFIELRKIMMNELTATICERGGMSFNSQSSTFKMNISDDNTYPIMCMVEMTLFTRFIFRLTFEQLCPNLSNENKNKLNAILDEGIEDAFVFDRAILTKRDEEYSSLIDESIVVGYSRGGDLMSNNKYDVESTDFLRKKSAMLFSDLIWIQGIYNKHLSMADCLNIASQKKIDIHEGLNNAKKSKGAFTYVDLVYQALDNAFQIYINPNASMTNDENTEPNKVRFCRKCGESLTGNSDTCRKCGTKIAKE